MKKMIALLLAMSLTLTAVSCGTAMPTEPESETRIEETISEPAEAAEPTADEETSDPAEPAASGDSAEPAAAEPTNETGAEKAPAADEGSDPADSSGETGKNEDEPVEEPTPIVMTVPTDYHQVYERILEAQNTRYGYSNGMVFAETEEAVADAAVDMPMEAPAPMPAAADDMVMKSEAAMEPASGSNGDYSETNAQVAGIDEGDIVKTDGAYIYVLKNGSELVILAADGENTRVLSDTVLYKNEDNYKSESKANGDYSYYSSYRYGNEMYIRNGVLAVLCTSNEWWEEYVNGTYDYDDKNESVVELYDVSDPTYPSKITTFGQDGWLSASRLMGDDLYLISQYSVYVYGDTDQDDYYGYIPYVRNEENEMPVPVDRIICPPIIDSTNYSVICRYNLASGEREDVKTILGAGNTVYMSPNALYLADTRYVSEETDSYQESVYTVTVTESTNRTEIIKLDLSDSLTVTASCEFEGDLLNQFSMDEYDGNLRVVATLNKNISTEYRDEAYGFSNWKWDSERRNALYVFDSDLNLLGSVGNLAEGEQVYSARFDGEVGYFVTFRTVDPLFAVNLSDPSNPQVMSELKIPGFSRYLHAYSDNLLFGLGQNADEETGWTENMKLSMFNVADPYAVFEQDKLTLDISYSTALYNHKAILVSPEKSLIGFPSENGYLLYSYSEETGFELIDEVKIDDFWWNDDSRGLYAGEYFYIVTPEFTVVLDMSRFDLVTKVKY